MKKILIYLLLLLVNYSFAQHNVFIKAGPNVSWFVNAENSTPKIGYSFGIGNGFHIYKGLFLEAGLGYSTRGATLENRTIQPYHTEGTDINAYYWEINGNIGYIDIPIHLKYGFKLNQKLTLSPIAGITCAIPKKDYSKFKQKKFYKIYNSDIDDRYDYDFYFWPELGSENNRIRYIYDFGFGVHYLQYSLNIMYSFDETQEYYFKYLDAVKYKISSISAYLSYEF